MFILYITRNNHYDFGVPSRTLTGLQGLYMTYDSRVVIVLAKMLA